MRDISSHFRLLVRRNKMRMTRVCSFVTSIMQANCPLERFRAADNVSSNKGVASVIKVLLYLAIEYEHE